MKAVENPEQNPRFYLIVEQTWKTQKAAADALKYSQSYISQIKCGERNVSKGILQKIAKIRPDVNIDWIITGDGVWNKPNRIGKSYQISDSIDFTEVEEEEADYGIAVLPLFNSYLEGLTARIKALESRVLELESHRDVH